MPPRKRARVSQAASPTPTSQPKTPTPAAASPPAKTSDDDDNDAQNDAWTEEEEVGLFKGLIKWKPTGIHKHFRLLALHQYMLSYGYIHPRNEHTKPAGIWKKLQTLYDLEALDEREDARQLSDFSIESGNDDEEDDVYSEAENKIHREDFTLPDDGFAELKWQQRFASDKETGEESPAALPELNLAETPPVRFTPSFSVEPSEAPTPSGRKRGRPAKGQGRGRGAATTLSTDARRRSARKAESVAEEEEPAEEPGGDEEGAEDESSEEDDDEESEESKESKESTPARSTRAGRKTRGRGGGRGRGRGRGRAK